MQNGRIRELPSPPLGKTGWPWTEESLPLPATMPDGTPWPKISIVTPSYNQGQFIEETLRSVLLQGYPNLEYIVIDGGSTDESVEIIEKYAPWLTYWVSEPDRGQAHAINKGWERSTGEVVAWLNSDDLYAPRALEKVATIYRQAPGGVVAGAVGNFSGEFASALHSVITQESVTWKRFLTYWKGNPSWHQPGMFFPAQALPASGLLNEQYHYCMDREFLVRLLQVTDATVVDEPLAYFRVHDDSKTQNKHLVEIMDEKSTIVRTHQHEILDTDKVEVLRYWVAMSLAYMKRNELKRALKCAIQIVGVIRQ